MLAFSNEYSALIRTYNCQKTLPATLRSLENQTHRPSTYVIVDSGSTDNTLTLVPTGALVLPFVGRSFNYSQALNQGLEHIATQFVLIISSHTALVNSEAIGHAIKLLESDQKIGAAYFCFDNTTPLRYELIDVRTFTGFNGLSNSCSLIKVPLLRERPFREDVFTAEDQEWARWLFTEKQMTVACFSGAGIVNRNPLASSIRKRTNEYIAVAYFTNRCLLKWHNILGVACRVVSPRASVRPRERLICLWLVWRLMVCRVIKPEVTSRYF